MNVSYIVELRIQLSSSHASTSANYALLIVPKHMIRCAADFFAFLLLIRQ
jgi:hypothetical protein